VRDRERTIHRLDEERLRVARTRGAGGRVSRVPDRVLSFERRETLGREHLADEPDVFVQPRHRAVGDGDACGLLSAVLQGE